MTRTAFTLLFIAIAAFLLSAFTNSRSGEPVNGKALFESNCARCHGSNGAKGFFGAANLKKSVMTDDAIIERIGSGKRFMPSFRKRLTPEEIKALAGYVKTLRSN